MLCSSAMYALHTVIHIPRSILLVKTSLGISACLNFHNDCICRKLRPFSCLRTMTSSQNKIIFYRTERGKSDQNGSIKTVKDGRKVVGILYINSSLLSQCQILDRPVPVYAKDRPNHELEQGTHPV